MHCNHRMVFSYETNHIDQHPGNTCGEILNHRLHTLVLNESMGWKSTEDYHISLQLARHQSFVDYTEIQNELE